MDSRKALFRAKLREQKQEKRIDSPLVKYNEYDQPVCRVCNITLKSDSLWAAHQASRKHHEAIENLKATATGSSRANSTKSDPAKELHKPRSSSTLPAGFFDKHETAIQTSDGKKELSSSGGLHVNIVDGSPNVHSVDITNKTDSMPSGQLSQRSRTVDGSGSKVLKRTLPEGFFEDARSEKKPFNQVSQPPRPAGSEVKQVKGALPEGFFDSKERNQNKPYNQLIQSSEKLDGLDAKQVKGTLPEGFFDNKDADLRARGIEPVKVDINDAYKEFEKEIQEDLLEVDDRLEEEEIDAAEIREEFESLEQKEYRERVEMVKKRLIEVRAAKLAKGKQPPAFMGHESSDDSSSDDNDEEDNFTVDWRAKHL